MAFNWLDVVLLMILVIALVLGVIKGLVRQLIGILAVIVGMILALAFYPALSSAFRTLVKNSDLRDFLGFLILFAMVLILGWLAGRMITKAMKGPLKFFNHVLGGALGSIKGALICGVLVFALLVFPVSGTALQNSRIAPYCVEITRVVIELIPRELKEAFLEAYEEIFGKGGGDVERI